MSVLVSNIKSWLGERTPGRVWFCSFSLILSSAVFDVSFVVFFCASPLCNFCYSSHHSHCKKLLRNNAYHRAYCLFIQFLISPCFESTPITIANSHSKGKVIEKPLGIFKQKRHNTTSNKKVPVALLSP